MNKKHIFTITKKEFLSFFNNPTGFLLIIPFILIISILYFQTAFLYGEASLRSIFDLLPFFLLFLAPTIAMRTFAQEQKNKTLELLYSQPVNEAEIVLGKFFGSMAFYLVLLLSTILLPLTTIIYAQPDLGVIISQYLGALFVGGAFLAIGIAAATLTSSQVASFLLGAAISFGFILLGMDFVLMAIPQFLSSFISELAIIPHMNNISRGALDLRDLLYFLTIIGTFLMLSIIKLSYRKTIEDKQAKQRQDIALILIIGIGIVLNILMQNYPLRLDLTTNRLFTLSKGTKQTLQNLPDVININLYNSENVPGQFQANVKTTKDLLKDYESLAKGKIKVNYRNPDTNEDDKKLANEEGIQPVQFNTVANNSFAVQNGYFGLSLQYSDKKEVIPFIQSTENLEYQLTRYIRKMTAKEKTKLAVLTQNQDKESIQLFNNNLETQYQLEDVTELDSTEAKLDTSALLIYGMQNSIGATASANIANYVNNGGDLLFLVENHNINTQYGTVSNFQTGLEDLMDKYGIKINQDLVYDLQMNETITLNGGTLQYMIPYPFWIKSIPADKNFSPTAGINSVSLIWSNSFDLETVEGVTHTKVLTTGQNAGSKTQNYNILPNKLTEETFANDELKPRTVAVAAQKNSSKILAVGDSEFIFDQFTNNDPNNLNFALNIIDWVAGDDNIASISRKSGMNPVFQFSSANMAQIVKWVNILLPSILVTAFAVFYLGKRKSLAQRKYQE
ncbi:ABC transporter permease subunit [Candidatus Beckwithbacteria bacterium]|nr:ABC transporter permease subunit [Candidatus Beckwithbacteria bacterium]